MLLTCAKRLLNVLVVDPCPDTTTSTQMLLESWGYSTCTANTALGALASVEQAPPDVILIEPYHLGMYGGEITRRLRAAGRNGRALIVAITGRTDDFSRIRASVAGCDLYLIKPVEPDQLRQLMDLCARQ